MASAAAPLATSSKKLRPDELPIHPLIEAVKAKNVELTAQLLQQLHSEDPQQLKAFLNDIDFASKYCMHAGEPAKIKSSSNRAMSDESLIFYCTRLYFNADIVKLLLRYGADLIVSNNSCYYLLFELLCMFV